METSTRSDVQQVEADWLTEWGERYLGAWNSHDPAAIGAMVADDVVWADPALPEPARGRAEVEQFARESFTAFPDMHFELGGPEAVATDGVTAFAPWIMRATNEGPIDPPGFAATGRRIEIHGIDEYQFRDGLIWRYRAYYDFAGVARQLGLMPEPDSRAVRIGVTLQRLRAKLRR